MPRGTRGLYDGSHWRTYGHPEETPQILLQSVDEIEFRLRMQFPEVFAAAAARRRLGIQRVFQK